MTEELHKAAQYLAAAGKSYVAHRADDSHTNTEWLPDSCSIATEPLGQFADHRLALNFLSYSLDFINQTGDVVDTLHLEGASHIGVVNWIGERAMFLEIGDLYSFDLHYELPYEDFNEEYVFPEPDYNELERMSDLRTLANSCIAHILTVFGVEADIRIWPHHFDTGAVIPLKNDGSRSVGLGLAVGDSMIDDEYFYVSGWSADESLVLEYMPDLDSGQWMFPDWNGATMLVGSASEKDVLTFFLKAVQAVQERSGIQ